MNDRWIVKSGDTKLAGFNITPSGPYATFESDDTPALVFDFEDAAQNVAAMAIAAGECDIVVRKLKSKTAEARKVKVKSNGEGLDKLIALCTEMFGEVEAEK